LTGKIVSVAADGSLVTDISAESLVGVPRDEDVSVSCDGHTTLGIHPADHGQPKLTLLAVLGQGGYLELSLVGESANAFLGIAPGADVVIKW
jgi:hypothetical protein